MDIISIALCASDMLLRRRYRSHHKWSAKDYIIFFIGIGAFMFARYFLPKFFPGIDDKKLERICTVIAFAVIVISFIITAGTSE